MTNFKKTIIKIIRFFWLIAINARIWFLRFFGAKIGKNVRILTSLKNLDLVYLKYLQIGDNVTIAKNTLIFTHDGARCRIYKDAKNQFGNVVIKNNAFIGAGSIILPNVSIGENTIIGAGSLVNKNIPDNVIAAGNPIKVLKNVRN